MRNAGDQSPQHERAQYEQTNIAHQHRHAESFAMLMFKVKMPLENLTSSNRECCERICKVNQAGHIFPFTSCRTANNL